MTPHDAHFKQLLRTFFAEFLRAFVPELARDLDRRSIQFLDKELFRLRGGGMRVCDFRFRVVQLNRMDWRDFVVRRPNPAATALMAKMKIAPSDRPKVRAQIQQMLVRLRLDPRKMDLIAGFVSTYLQLNANEHLAFQQEVD